MTERHYPVGIQTFSEIIREGYVYIDKTDLMWHMQYKRKYIFLSRPRRFGKSLLSSTLHSFFEGDKELFKGLKVMSLEKEWNHYPVIHLDLSLAKGQANAAALSKRLMLILKPYTKEYGSDPAEKTPGGIIDGLIQRKMEVPSTAFDLPTENMEDALPLLYQCSYLTIKDYNPELDTYVLSIPNQEVRIGYARGLLPSYTGIKATDVQM